MVPGSLTFSSQSGAPMGSQLLARAPGAGGTDIALLLGPNSHLSYCRQSACTSYRRPASRLRSPAPLRAPGLPPRARGLGLQPPGAHGLVPERQEAGWCARLRGPGLPCRGCAGCEDRGDRGGSTGRVCRARSWTLEGQGPLVSRGREKGVLGRRNVCKGTEVAVAASVGLQGG